MLGADKIVRHAVLEDRGYPVIEEGSRQNAAFRDRALGKAGKCCEGAGRAWFGLA